MGCALALALRDAGRSVIGIKPVETGRSGRTSDWEDGVRLARATGQAEPTQAILRFADAISPVLASERAGAEVDFDSLILKIERWINGAEFALIEGAGGLLTPVTWEWNMTDVARTLGACALLVAVDQMGTINHTLLTLSALELAGIPVAGVVLTTPEATDRSTGANGPAIIRLSGLDRVMALPRLIDPNDGAAAMAPVVGWLGRVGVAV